jgi:16S rRNA (cytidine1402-2'-O)-methyltransferase
MFKNGVLYLVSTPIGNLEDITLRAIRILNEVDIIAAEDSRRTLLLLEHLGIKKQIESYHGYNRNKQTPRLIEKLLIGKNIALVTDAGTPGISDPSYNLVVGAIKQNIQIIPIPGPTAAIAAIVVSGLPTERFSFEGFLPTKKGRRRRLEEIEKQSSTVVLFEAPHRLLKTLNDLKNVLGNRPVAVCRELTKKFEEIVRGNIDDVLLFFNGKSIRGEFVLVIQGKGTQDV